LTLRQKEISFGLEQLLFNPNKKTIKVVCASTIIWLVQTAMFCPQKQLLQMCVCAITLNLFVCRQQNQYRLPYYLTTFKKATAQAFKKSKSYNVGGGIAGKQKAVFQAFAGKGYKCACQMPRLCCCRSCNN
jgi:hypothetical protein